MVPVFVEPINGRFSASLANAPAVWAEGDTREEAVAALRAEIETRVQAGELYFISPPPQLGGIADMAGRFKDDPGWHALWDEIVREAYRERDEEKAREFPE